MSTVQFGHFSLIDLRSEESVVVIAPEHILLQRAREGAVHDLSYLVVWSDARAAALTRELKALAGTGPKAVDATTPELKHLLHAIAPAATPVFQRTGQCSRIFVRRQLKAALQAPGATPLRKTAS